MTNLTKAQIKIYNNDIKINRNRDMAMAYREREGGRGQGLQRREAAQKEMKDMEKIRALFMDLCLMEAMS
jgi:hypothetical protein